MPDASPSELPKFRGGSPIQNQIIRGVYDSSVTIFKINDQIDAGPIIAQSYLDLRGDMSEILQRLTDIGFTLTRQIFLHGFNLTDQDSSQVSFYPRRTPDMSEITLNELTTMPSTYLHDKIRMLQDPYPSAYIRTSDGKKLYIHKSSVQ